MNSDLNVSASGVLDDAEAADYLSTTVRHIRRLRTEHGLPFVRLGNKIRFLQADLDSFLANAREVSA